MNSVFILNFKEPYDQNYAIFFYLSGDGIFIWSYFSMRFFFFLSYLTTLGNFEIRIYSRSSRNLTGRLDVISLGKKVSLFYLLGYL